MIKVLIVDDSALVRQMLSEILSADREIEVVGVAQDPHIAREKIKKLCPDVITLDIEMPRMDGITFLEKLMRLRPLPVVMVSSLTKSGADTTLRALEIGAVDYVQKPAVDVSSGLKNYAQELIGKVKTAARARVRPADNPHQTASRRANVRPAPIKTTDKIIAIGASTGGTEAIREILEVLPADFPAVVIAQHIPVAFSQRFANRLNSLCSLKVGEALDGEQILPGHAYVAPGNAHFVVERDGARYVSKLSTAAPVNQHRPSVDVLFDSVACNCGPNAVGVILTGMGCDGAKGLKRMRSAGAHTIAQDEKSSVVWGMPGEAVKIGAVNDVVPLQKIAMALGAQFSQ